MDCGTYLRELLRPLGVYRWEEGSFQTAEVEGLGAALDGCAEELERVAREMVLCTAQESGLAAVEGLLPYRPVTGELEGRRNALAALLRIGGDSFTLAAINDNLAGCGVNAVVAETDEPGVVQVAFPGVAGVPHIFEELRAIIEDIIPCHLAIRYVYSYTKWSQMEARFGTWREIEEKSYTWDQLERIDG